ncbi:hypothetical protein CDEF62S_05853 [Castellaniella defragrans]
MRFPQSVIERVVARQGTLHSHATLNPRTTAFVVVDLQNYYTQPNYQGYCAAAAKTFPAVNTLARELRFRGGTVIWVRTNADGASQFWSHHHQRMLTPERSKRRLLELGSHHQGYALAAELEVLPEDLQVIKRCYSALTPGSSSLGQILHDQAIDTVLIARHGHQRLLRIHGARRHDDRSPPSWCTDTPALLYRRRAHPGTCTTGCSVYGDVLERAGPGRTLHPAAARGPMTPTICCLSPPLGLRTDARALGRLGSAFLQGVGGVGFTHVQRPARGAHGRARSWSLAPCWPSEALATALPGPPEFPDAHADDGWPHRKHGGHSPGHARAGRLAPSAAHVQLLEFPRPKSPMTCGGRATEVCAASTEHAAVRIRVSAPASSVASGRPSSAENRSTMKPNRP